MDRCISIRPSKDIRTNYAGISALTRENPVAITVNGKEDTVDTLFETLCKDYGVPDEVDGEVVTEEMKIKILAIWQE